MQFTSLIRFLLLLALAFLALLVGVALFQRRLIYFPTHHRESNGLSEWRHRGEMIGYVREAAAPANVWLLLHGNGGQASDRSYALRSFSDRDSVYILEYPGYGSRPGAPSMGAINTAAVRAYELLRSMYPRTPVCVAGESIGSGPASFLATNQHPPDRIVLIVPFDTLVRVAAHHFPLIPARLLLRDRWNNIESLARYTGPLDIYAAREDTIIPAARAQALAAAKPSARLHLLEGGHNDWSLTGRVAIRN